jgi:hypothetical protein
LKRFRQMQRSAVIIQTRWRGFVARKNFRQTLMAVITLQTYAKR